MKIDLVGPKQRGLAMVLNEFAGYLAVSLSALATGYLAATYGLRPIPFIPGLLFAFLGLLLSLLFVRDTRDYANFEADIDLNRAQEESLGKVNSGETELSFGQLFTGALSDRWGRKWLIVAGMWVQAAGIALLVIGASMAAWLVAAMLLGLGTAMVYPTLLAAVSDVAHPTWRGSAVGVYRLWRDLGFAAGAVLAGILADIFNITVAIAVIGGLTFVSGVIVAGKMYETLPSRRSKPL